VGGSSTGGQATSSGAFDAGSAVAALGDEVAASLTITADELELYFVAVLGTGYPIMVLTRPSATVAFGDARAVPELQAACEDTNYPTIDVSNDGLRMYITCLDGSSPLRLATRASRSAAWVVADGSVGTVADSVTISDDELTAGAVVGLLPTDQMPTARPRPVLYQRASIDEPFGEPVPASIDQDFMNPDLACGNRTLFGAVRIDERSRLAFSIPGAAFGAYSAPSTQGMPLAPDTAGQVHDYTPTVTPDCQRMYFLRATLGSGTAEYTIQFAERR
jgi:hypothetical protein